jgi:hypothetical protein
MKTIKLSNGMESIVDDDDFESLSQNKWHILRNGYARRPGKQRDKISGTVYMHRQIMGFPNGLQVDHINGNKLDNRKCNLRLATNSQNHCNRGKQANNTSGYKGVSWHKQANKWNARIVLLGRKISLGLYNDPKDASEAYLTASKIYHGEFSFHG